MQAQDFGETDGLTKNEQKILEYITSKPDMFLFMSIGQLAEHLEVSEATVSRFAKSMGCKNFKDLKTKIMQQQTETGAALKIAGSLMEEEEFSIENWLERQMVYMQKTMAQLDTQEFMGAVEDIVKAKRVYIHGKSASKSMAQLLFFRLYRLGIPVTLLPSGGSEIVEGLVQMTKDDVIIMFSFSKVSREGRLILNYKKQLGFRTIIFTGRRCLPEEDCADRNLYVCRGEEKEYHSMTAPAAMVDGLVLAISERLGVQSAERLMKIQKLKKEF